MSKIPCIYFRGGTSKGLCFLKSDLPSDLEERDQLLLKIMGSPHQRQIDGLGGGSSLSSKVVIIEKSKRPGIDINYYFCQVLVQEPRVESMITCGNMLSTVAPFAIEKGLIKAEDPQTTVKIYDENTGIIMESIVQTPHGKITYHGATTIDGVPGASAPIKLTFFDAGDSRLLPTGNIIDEIEGVFVSCVNIGAPLVIAQASTFGKLGDESKEVLEGDKKFMENLEMLRRKAAIKMKLGDVTDSLDPRICLVSQPHHGGAITVRYFTPFDCHVACAVSAGFSIGAACLLTGSVAHRVAVIESLPETQDVQDKEIIIEHPSGNMPVIMSFQGIANQRNFPKASCFRTARPLLEGDVIIN